ncbi:espin protein forked isoform X3 [Bombus fervidus]|uniref:espin protein forked isoform X3 n=1 Tax=Bombus fervidus TaxID=203811 RepID=UPI003AB63131
MGVHVSESEQVRDRPSPMTELVNDPYDYHPPPIDINDDNDDDNDDYDDNDDDDVLRSWLVLVTQIFDVKGKRAKKCSLRGCGMFQEPFFLHPPGSRPRDGIYINPMSAYIGEPVKPKDTESFYLHSPHDLVYTRITRLFADTDKHRHFEKKDETLTVKVDVHFNNGVLDRSSGENGYTTKAEMTREPSEHAYEQICLRQDPETAGIVASPQRKVQIDNVSDRSRSRKTDRRYSRSSSASESSNVSSEIPCFSSSASTPSLSRNSSNERAGKKFTVESSSHGTLNRRVRFQMTIADRSSIRFSEKKNTTSTSSQVESEKEIKPANGGVSFAKPPPPPPPPPLPEKEDVVVLVVNAKQNAEPITRDEKRDVSGETNRNGRTENGAHLASAAINKSDVSCGEHQQPEVPPASPPADTEEIKTNQTSHLVNKHMVLPFIPPKFANADSNTLLKPSEYLKSICKISSKSSLLKARSVDNLDIQSRSGDRREGFVRPEGTEEQEQEELREALAERGATRKATRELEEEEEEEDRVVVVVEEGKESTAGPPPPPLSPLQKSRRINEESSTVAMTDLESQKTLQPLATISIQDLTSIQLRRTSAKMNATKTFSAPPPRSVSMTNVSEPFFVQKTDLIAELKRTKDIPGIKKMKVEMAQVEKTQEQNLMSEINKAFNVSNFVDQIPEKDSSGNVIPIWKRQMLARKAAERAKKELEEQLARENEERRQKAIPAWKRQLLAKKDNEEKRLNQVCATPTAKVDAVATPTPTPTPTSRRDVSPSSISSRTTHRHEEKPDAEEKKPADANSSHQGSHGTQSNETDDDAQIIPWRAQLRKTSSKLNILD